MAVTASGRFINTVAQCFDENMVFDRSRLDPPTSPLVENELTQRTQACSRVVLDQITAQHPNIENEDRIAPLPEDIKILLIEHAATISDWLDLTEMFETDASDPELEARIEMCSKLKLEQWLEQANQRIELLSQDWKEKRKAFLRLGEQRLPDADAEEQREKAAALMLKSWDALISWQKNQVFLQKAIWRSGKKETKALLFANILSEAEPLGAARKQAAKRCQDLEDLPPASRNAEDVLSAEVEKLLVEIKIESYRENLIPCVQHWGNELVDFPPVAKAKDEVLKCIFHIAFNAPFSELSNRNTQRDRIIAQLEQYKPALEAKLSQRQRLSLRLSEISAATLGDPIFQGASVAVFYLVIRRVIQIAAAKLFSIAQLAIPTGTFAPLLSTIPPIALKVASIAGAVFSWIWMHQVLILLLVPVLLFLMAVLRVPEEIARGIMNAMPWTVLFPTAFLIGIFLPYANQTNTSLNSISHSLRNYSTTKREARDKLEEQQGLKLWLQMAELAAEQRTAAQQ